MVREDRVDRTKRALSEVHDEFAERILAEQAQDSEDQIEEAREEQKVSLEEEGNRVQQELAMEEGVAEERVLEEIDSQTEDEIALESQIQEQQNGPNDERPGPNKESVSEAKKILKDGGHSMSTEEVVELANNKPEKEGFPIGILFFVLIKDAFDIITDLSVVLIVLKVIYWPIYFVIMLNWNLGRLNKLGRAKRYILKKVMNRFIAGAVLEAIPGIDALPFATVFFFLNYYAHTKFVQLLIRASDIAVKL